MFDREKILNSVKKPEDKLFFAKALGQAYICIKSFQPAFTDFTDPFKAGELISLMGFNSEFRCLIYGGYTGAERVKVGFFPDYIEEDFSLFPIRAVKISYNAKFSSALSHRDFLGSVLGLGIDRNKIGDIILKDDYAVVMADKEITDYIIINLERVSHTKVKCGEIPLEEAAAGRAAREDTVIVSSLRLDAVLSAAFKISRARAVELIASGRAFVNWKCIEAGAKSVAAGDVLTLRGTGRVKIKDIKGKTKKDRLVLNILKYG